MGLRGPCGDAEEGGSDGGLPDVTGPASQLAVPSSWSEVDEAAPGVMRGPGSQGHSQRGGAPGLRLHLAESSQTCCSGGRSGPSSPIQPLVPRATHTWLPLPHSPGTGRSFQQLPEVPMLTAQALQDLLVHVHSPSCCFSAMAPSPLREHSPPPPSTRTTAAASWPFLPCLPSRPLAPPPTPPPHISLGPPTSSCQPPSPPPSFSHQHLNPADCSHPLDSCHRT